MSTAALDLKQLVLNGQDAGRHYADLIDAVQTLTMTETITGASTVTVGLRDPKRQIVTSAALTARSTVVLDRAAFELVKVRKSGALVTATFEGLNVARLRRHTSYRKAAPGTTTRPGFVKTLIGEEPDIRVVTATGATTNLVELARGSGATTRRDAQKEDTWTAAGRILGEIGWRCYEYRGVIYQAPDSWLLAHNGAPYKLSPTLTGVDDIDFDWDTGKPAAGATLYLRAGFHDLTPGTPLDLSGLGAGNGRWLVESIERSPFTTLVTVTAIRAQPTLPEPTEPTAGTAGESGVTAWNGDYTEGIGSGGSNIDDFNVVSVTPIGPGIKGPTGASAEHFVNVALAQKGKPYVYGASGPNAWDCSGFVQWVAAQCGVHVSKPVSNIAQKARDAGATLSIERAAYTRGAIIWRQQGGGARDHIVISIGDGTHTIEAMGSAYGVVVGKIGNGRKWTGAGWVPGIHVTPPATKDLRPG